MLNVDFVKQEMEEQKFSSDLQNSKDFELCWKFSRLGAI